MVKRQSKIQSGARLDPDLVEAVRQYAQTHGMTISEVYADALSKYIGKTLSPEQEAQLIAKYVAKELAQSPVSKRGEMKLR